MAVSFIGHDRSRLSKLKIMTARVLFSLIIQIQESEHFDLTGNLSIAK